MEEKMRILMLLASVCLVGTAHAQEAIGTDTYGQNPTIVWGEAENPDGTMNEYIVEQGADEANPLGMPIATQPNEDDTKKDTKMMDKPDMTDEDTEDNQIQPQNSNQNLNNYLGRPWTPEDELLAPNVPTGNPIGEVLPERVQGDPLGVPVDDNAMGNPVGNPVVRH